MDKLGSSERSKELEKVHKKPLVKDLNGYLICILCGGYYVDATTIVECLHSFCRSCIVKYLQTQKFCPICDVQVHKSDPLLSLRPDYILQSVIYKVIPGLYASEISRRLNYEIEDPVDKKPETKLLPVQDESAAYFYSPDDLISVCLEYYDDRNLTEQNGSEKRPQIENWNVSITEQAIHRKYLQCPAAFTVGHLQKFLKMKYSLTPRHQVQILYADDELLEEFTLMDIAYTYSWDRLSPMRLGYCILKTSTIRVVESCLKNDTPEKVTETISLLDEGEKITESRSKRKRQNRSLSKNKRNSALGNKTYTNVLDKIIEDVYNEKEDIGKEEVNFEAPIPSCNDKNNNKTEQDIEIIEIEDSDSREGNEQPEDDLENPISLRTRSAKSDKGSKRSHEVDILSSDDEEGDHRRKKKKKSKRHHHHKRHEKKKPFQATILHTNDADIMKLKVKLNPVEEKPRKKRKKIPVETTEILELSKIETDPQIEEISSNLRLSEVLSPEHDLPPKEETPQITTSELLQILESDKEDSISDPVLESKVESPLTNEEVPVELNQSCAAKEVDQPAKMKTEPEPEKVQVTSEKPAEEVKVKKPRKSVPGLLKPMSGITVSKIATPSESPKAEKSPVGLGGPVLAEKKPSLEITLVNITSSETKEKQENSKQEILTNGQKSEKSPRLRPPPPVIPLSKFNRMKAEGHSLSPSLTISPARAQTQQNRNLELVKGFVLTAGTSANRNGDVSSTQRSPYHEIELALDLSGGPTRTEKSGSLSPNASPNRRGYRHSISLDHMRPPPKPPSIFNGMKPPSSNPTTPSVIDSRCAPYSPVRSLSSLAEYPIINGGLSHMKPSYKSMIPPSKLPKCNLPLGQLSPKIQTFTSRIMPNMPKLNEIKIGPRTSASDTSKPGPNQTVRQIPNPSALLFRHNMGSVQDTLNKRTNVEMPSAPLSL